MKNYYKQLLADWFWRSLKDIYGKNLLPFLDKTPSDNSFSFFVALSRFIVKNQVKEMPKLTRKKPRYRKSDRAINEPSVVKPIPIEPDDETETILARIEAERDYYHTCTDSQY